MQFSLFIYSLLHFISPPLFLFLFYFCFGSVSPEFAYRAGLGVVPEGTASVSSTGASAGSGSSSSSAPNRPLPPTPDDDESLGDGTLIARKVSFSIYIFSRYRGYLLLIWILLF